MVVPITDLNDTVRTYKTMIETGDFAEIRAYPRIVFVDCPEFLASIADYRLSLTASHNRSDWRYIGRLTNFSDIGAVAESLRDTGQLRASFTLRNWKAYSKAYSLRSFQRLFIELLNYEH